ncbi:MAG: CoA pyrophosphatase [Anaerovoracaceae bacterium]
MNNLTVQGIQDIFNHRKPGTVGRHKFFSVLIPLVEKDGELHVLYEIRAKNLNRQPGEVCFPGGAIEEDETPLACARRETCEELGLTKNQVEVLSKAGTLYTVSNFTMYSYIGVIRGEIHPSEDEVDSTFLVPLRYLMENPPEMHFMEMLPKVGDDFPYDKIDFQNGYKWRKGKSEIPIYLYEDKIIWGVTARVTNAFIRVLKEAECK